MSDDRTLFIGQKRPARDPNQTLVLRFNRTDPRPSLFCRLKRRFGRRRASLLAVGLALGAGGLLVERIPLIGAVVASGVVKAADQPESVRPLERGVVEEIRSWDGERGGAARPGGRLPDSVPEAGPLLIEARVEIDDIDAVRLEQPTDIRLTADSTRETPLLAGTVRYIFAGQLTDPRTGAPHYLAQVAVDAASLAQAGGVHLQPGMRAELFIKTGERTVLDYLLEPVMAILRRVLSEP